MAVAVIRPPARHGASIETESGETAFIFDATTSESHTLSATPSSHPLEDGTQIADHIQLDPAEVTVVGVVTNSPLPIEVISGGSSRDFKAWHALEVLLKARQPLRLVTPLKTYENMALTSMSTTRDPNTGQAISAVLTFQELLFSESLIIEVPAEIIIPPAQASGSSAIDAGRTQAETPTGAEAEVGASWAAQAFDAFR